MHLLPVRALGPAPVYSLEPLPRNFKYLTMNLRRAKLLDRVTPINLALGVAVVALNPSE